MEQRNNTIEIDSILGLVRRTAQLLKKTELNSGLTLVLGLLFSSLLLMAMLDLLIPFNRFMRSIALLIILLPALGVLGKNVLRPLMRQVTLVSIARKIEKQLRGIHNRLVTCVDLMLKRAAWDPSPAFYNKLIQETLERIRDFKPASVLNLPRLRHNCIFAAGAVVVFVFFVVLLYGRLPTSLLRMLLPLADIPPAASVAYDVWPGNAKFLRGDDIQIVALVKRGSPEKLRLEMRDDTGRRLHYQLQKKANGKWSFSLGSFEHSFQYRISGGGTWTKYHQITLLDRPEITGLQAILHYPSYMGNTPPHPGPPQIADVSGPVGSSIEVLAQVSGNVASGQIQLVEPIMIDITNVVTNLTAIANRQYQPTNFNILASFSMKHDTNSQQWSGRFPLDNNGHYRLVFRSELGHPNKPMLPGKLTAIPDVPPQIVIERPGNDMVLMVGVKLPLIISAGDDYGLKEVSVNIQRGQVPLFTTPFTTSYPAAQRNDALAVSLDLSAMDLQLGESVRYFAQARDCKGQVTKSKDYFVLISRVNTAADARLAKFAQDEDAFMKRLLEMIAAQKAVHGMITNIDIKYLPMVKRLDAEATKKQRILMEEDGSSTQSVDRARLLNLDEETAKQLEALRVAMREAAALQQKNMLLAQMALSNLIYQAEQAGRLELLPTEFGDQLKFMGKGIHSLVIWPMQKLTANLNRGGSSVMQTPKNMAAMHYLSQRLQQDLKELPYRFAAFTNVLKIVETNYDEDVMGEVQAATLDMQAAMIERELEDLHRQMLNTRDDTRSLEDEQEALLEALFSGGGTNTQKVAEQVEMLFDEEIEPVLKLAIVLTGGDDFRKGKTRRALPKAPYDPETMDGFYVPEELGAPPDIDTNLMTHINDTSWRTNPIIIGPRGPRKKIEDVSEDPLIDVDDEQTYISESDKMRTPPGGKDELDPRYKDKMRPWPKQPRHPLSGLEDSVTTMSMDNLENLNTADDRLTEDMHSLEKMMDGLENMQRTSRSSGSGGEEMAQFMASTEIQNMLGRSSEAQGMQPPSPAGEEMTSVGGGGGTSGPRKFDTGAMNMPSEIDPEMRSAILKLPPAIREELLQGMREEGPAVYRQFIKDYFRLLTKVNEK